MTQYQEPAPYVLPEEDEKYEDDTPEIEINLTEFEEDARCIFFYAFRRNCISDLMVYKTTDGQTFWSIEDHSFSAASTELLTVLRWILDVADRMMEDFETYWGTSPDYWVLPQCPEGWKVVIK